MTSQRILRHGDNGDDVRTMQQMLIAKGYGHLLGSYQDDGKFGPYTQRALEAFQRDNGLTPDGIAGSKTLPQLGMTAPVTEHSPTAVATTPTIPASPSGGWQLSVQKTGTEASPHGYTIALGDLILTDPSGKSHRFPMRSGGHGQYGNQSMLPGLDANLNSTLSGLNARYLLDWGQLSINSSALPNAMKGADGTGSWLRLGSIDTDRGGVVGKDSKGFFGIHTDGPSTKAAGGGIGDGTQGCIGLEPSIAQQFFALLSGIPAAQRPSHLEVLPPTTVLAALDGFKAPGISQSTTAFDLSLPGMPQLRGKGKTPA